MMCDVKVAGAENKPYDLPDAQDKSLELFKDTKMNKTQPASFQLSVRNIHDLNQDKQKSGGKK